MTKDEIFDKIDEVYSEHDGGVIYLNEERTNQIKEIIQQAINYTHCCTEFADGKCKPMVNADWTYLRCECGKRFEPKG
jgi:hypothetical protein